MSLARPDTRELSWEEAQPGNVRGVARALTAIGPLRPGFRYQLLLFGFLLRRWCPLYRNARARALRNLSFVHFARWALIMDLPAADGVSRRRLRPVYLFFESNFNGGFDEYIDAFAYVLTKRMEELFGSAYNWPGAMPAGPFKAFIRRHSYEAEVFYSAYDDTTATDVGRALTLQERFDALREATKGSTDEEFMRSWHGFLTEVQSCL